MIHHEIYKDHWQISFKQISKNNSKRKTSGWVAMKARAPKVQFLVLCCFQSKSMTYQQVYHQILRFLQIALLTSVVCYRNTSANELNYDLLKIRK